MPWYHFIAAFIHCHLDQVRATRRDNLAILTAALLGRRALAISELARRRYARTARKPPPTQKAHLALHRQHQLCPHRRPMRPGTRHLPPGRS